LSQLVWLLLYTGKVEGSQICGSHHDPARPQTNAIGRYVKKVSAQVFKWILLPLNTDFAAQGCGKPFCTEFAAHRCGRKLIKGNHLL